MGAVSGVAASLLSTATAYLPSLVLHAAVELGLVDALDEPRTAEDVARIVGATPDGVERLCRALVALGVLEREGTRYRAPTEVRAALSRDGEGSIARVIHHHHAQVAPLMARLADAVRTGRPQHAAWPFASPEPADHAYAELARHPDEHESFLEAMDRSSEGVGRAIAATVDLSRVGRLVDLGCGGGGVARELLEALPGLVVESFDVPEACARARARSVAAGLGDRHLVRAGDLLVGVDATGADVALLSAILADWSPAERARILDGARRALRPGGLLLVSETLLDDDRTGPPSAALLSLVMLVAMRGDQLSAADLRRELEAAGFGEVTVHRGGPRDLVTARAPA